MPEEKEYIKEIYDYLGTLDNTYQKDVSFDGFKKSMEDKSYASDIHSWIGKKDPSFVKDVPVDSFYNSINVKKKEPAISLGYKTTSELLESGGLPKQEKPLVLKTAATTTPSVSTKQKTNLDYLTDINNLYKEKVSTSQERVNTKRELLNLQPQIDAAYSEIEGLTEISNNPELSIQERNNAIKNANALLEQISPIKLKYEELGLKYNDLVQKDKQAVIKLKELDNLRQSQLEKEFSIGKDLLEKTGKGFVDAAAGMAGIFNTLGFSGDPESPETREEAKAQTRQNIDKIRDFGNSLVTQETPKEWQSAFEGKFSPKKLAYMTSQAVSSTVPTVAAGLFTGGAGTMLAGAGMGFNESKDILKEAGLNNEQAEWASLGLSVPLGLLEEFGAGDIVKILSSPTIKKKVASELVKNLVGKKITKELLFNEAKKSLGKVIAKNAGGIITTGVKESGTEMAQGAFQEVAKQAAQEYTGKDPDQEIPFEEYIKGFAKQRAEEGVGGFLGGTTLAGGGQAIQSGLNAFKSDFKPSVYAQVKEFADPEKLQEFQEDLQAEVEQGLITPEQADEAMQNVQAISDADNLIPSSIVDNDIRTKAVNLIIEKKNIEKDIEGKDKSLVTPLTERVSEIDNQLVAISKGEPIKETTTEETDGKGRIEEPISAGTNVAEEGLGMAIEPSGEGVTGEGIQAEAVPQAPLEEQKVPEEITNEYLLNTLPEEKNENNTGKVMITTDKFGSTKTRYIPFEIIEQANKNDKLGGQTAKEINDRGGYTDKELDRKLPNWRTMLSKPEVVSEKITEVTAPAIEVTPTAGSVVGEERNLDVSREQNKGVEIADLKKQINEGLGVDMKITPNEVAELNKLEFSVFPKDDIDKSDITKPIILIKKRGFPNMSITEALADASEEGLGGKSINNLSNYYEIVDGRHRIKKAISEGKGLNAVVITEAEYEKATGTKLYSEETQSILDNIGVKTIEEGIDFLKDKIGTEAVDNRDVLIEEKKFRDSNDKKSVKQPLKEKPKPAKEAAKPTKTERKAIAEAKIDDLAAKAKEFLRNKNLPEGTKVSGVSQDKVIDILASTVKALVNSGIEISEAIKQVRELFEQDFDTSAIKDYEINQAIAKDELTDVAKENGFSSYREAVFAVNKYVREVGKEDVITKDEIEKAKEAKDKEAEAPKKGYTSKKKKAQEGEKGTTVKETGRSKSYEEGRVPVSEAFNEVVNAQKEYYETMNQKATLEQAEEYLAEYGNTEQGLLDAYDDMMKAFRDNPFLDARNAIAIELLADRMFARALDFQKAGQSDKYNRFLEKSEDLRKEAFKAHYKAGQFNAAVGVFSRSVNPDAFLSFVNGQVKEGLENFKKTKPNVYEKYEQEVKDFQGKVKDIKKAAAQQAVVSAPNSTTKVNVKLSDKLKARYEQGKARQAEALKKLGKINFFGSSGLSNEAIEAVGELVLAQFEQGIYKAATIIEKIIEITEGKLTEKNIKDVYDAYKVNYKGEKLTLTELEEVLRKEEIAEKQKPVDTDAALEKEREKLAKLKADYEQAVVDKADALVLKRAQQFVKDQEKKVKEQEDKAKKAATAKTAEGKRPTLSDLLQRDLEADLTKEAIAKNLVTEGGLSEREANKLAEIYYNKYRKILKEKIQAQLVKDLTPRKVKEIEAQMNALDGKPFGKTLGGMIANQVAAGALDSESLRAAFAAKYGIPAVSPIVAANIRALSAKVRAAKTTLGVNLANKNLLTYINSTVKTKKGSIISTLYYVSILSGISTAVVNTYGNVNNLINQSTENFVQSIIEAKQGNKGNLASNVQVTAKIRKAVSNLVESFTSFIDIMAYGGGESRYSTMKKGTFGSFESEDLILKKKDLKDLGFKKAFTALAKLYKTAPAFFVRNLPASDEGFYMANFNMEATRELRKKLYSEGLRGEELEKKVYEQVYGTKDIKAQAINEAIQELKRIGINPSSRKLLVNRIAKEIILKKLDETVQNAANELAKENTFRGQPRGATGYLSQKIPQLWLVTPFVSTPFKMAEKMINYIPLYGAMRYYGFGITDTLRKLGPVDAEFKKKGIEYAKKEGELRNKQLAQVLTGHLLALAFWGLSQIDWEDEEGNVVPFVDASAGYYGTSRTNREKLKEALPEYTIRVGNFKFSYKTNPLLAMIALPFGVTKDSERAYEEMDFADWSNIYNKEILSFLYESTPIKGLQEFFKNIGETFDIEGDDRTWEDFAQIPVKQAAALGANLAIDNLYKQMFDFYDPTKYVVQDNKEVLYKAFNMENIGGLQTDYDRWGREIKFYPGEAFFPIQYMFKDKTDKEITDWEIKNDITIPKTNRKTLVLNDRKLKTEKAIEKEKEELRKDYGIESDEYKLFEETLNADFKLLTYSEYQAYDKTVRSEIFDIIKTNFDNVTEEYKKFYKESINDQQRDVDIKPISKLSRPEAKKLVEILFKIKRRDYINKNFTKID